MKKITLFLLFCVSLTSSAQDGSWDESFDMGEGFDEAVNVIRILDNGKILVAGGFTHYDENYVNTIVRLNPDGSYDYTFGATLPNTSVSDMLVEEDGKIIVADYYSPLIRINEDGSLDTTFNSAIPSSPYGMNPAYVKKQGDKYIVSGQFFNVTAANGNHYSYVARLNYDGSLDDTFTPVSFVFSFYNTLPKIFVQEDSKIFVMGDIEKVNNVPITGIARLYANGTLDTSFNVNFGGMEDSSVNAIAVQPDGKYIVSGFFVKIDGIDRFYVARLNNDGTLDETFFIPLNDVVGATKVLIQPDNKILLAGGVTYYNDNRLVLRYHPDGSPDTGFDVGAGFNSPVIDIALSDDGKIIAGGWFTDYGWIVTCNRIIRLNNTVLANEYFTKKTTSVYPNPTNDKVFLNNAFEGVVGVKLFDITGKMLFERTVANSNEVADLSGFAKGVYFIQLTSGGKTFTQKVVKN